MNGTVNTGWATIPQAPRGRATGRSTLHPTRSEPDTRVCGNRAPVIDVTGHHSLTGGPVLPQLSLRAVLEYSTFATQAIVAGVVGAILLVLHRRSRSHFLTPWAWSWLALSAYLVFAAVAIMTARMGPSFGGTRQLFSVAALVCGYAQLVWLLVGAYALAADRPLARSRERFFLALAVMLAVVVVVASMGPQATTTTRLVMRYGVRSLAAAAAFLAVGWVAWRARAWRPGRGRAIVAAACVGIAVLQLHAFLQTTHLLTAHAAGGAGAANLLEYASAVLIALAGAGTVLAEVERESEQARQASEAIAHLAYHDGLTGLPNSRLFVERLTHAVALAAEGGAVAAVCVNIDGFKNLNASLGRPNGDVVLRAVGERLAGVLADGGLVARLAGDEFGVVLTRLDGRRDAERRTRRLLDELQRPFTIGNREVRVTACAGFCLHPEDARDAESLIRRADAALHAAKQGGRGTCAGYSADLDRRAGDRLALEGALPRALAGGEFELYYQPIVTARGQELVRLEALVRWHHAERGLLLPGEFLPVAEAAGQSVGLDLFVLHRACTQLREWRSRGLRKVQVAVNVSAHLLQEPDLLTRMLQVLAETRADPEEVELELTETVAMLDPDASVRTIRALREIGFRVALDDFGTGYSSLAYLRTLPLDALKVDRSFVHDLVPQGGAASITQAIITLGHTLRMQVVAEGVETEEQRALLAAQGCDLMQGFLIGRPLPSAECERLLVTTRTSGEGRRALRHSGG